MLKAVGGKVIHTVKIIKNKNKDPMCREPLS